jgi:hypothetical protein
LACASGFYDPVTTAGLPHSFISQVRRRPTSKFSEERYSGIDSISGFISKINMPSF